MPPECLANRSEVSPGSGSFGAEDYGRRSVCRISAERSLVGFEVSTASSHIRAREGKGRLWLTSVHLDFCRPISAVRWARLHSLLSLFTPISLLHAHPHASIRTDVSVTNLRGGVSRLRIGGSAPSEFDELPSRERVA